MAVTTRKIGLVSSVVFSRLNAFVTAVITELMARAAPSTPRAVATPMMTACRTGDFCTTCATFVITSETFFTTLEMAGAIVDPRAMLTLLVA